MTSNEESSGNMGVGYCPYSPYDNSTAVLVGDRLYSGTTADAQGVDALIYSNPLRTPQFDSMFLNKPSFVGSFATSTKLSTSQEETKELRVTDGEFVYFFFREDSMEYMNCGKKVYSRVARVCQKDTGGTRSLNNKWTSFIKVFKRKDVELHPHGIAPIF
jgi:semaphorin 6